MKLAYFSPFNPIKSGISDFSEELVLELGKSCDITIFTMDGEVSNSEIKHKFQVLSTHEYHDEKVRSQFDVAIFHIGNNYLCHKDIIDIFMAYGGILEIHDIAMQHYLAESTIAIGKSDEYVKVMTYCHGNKGKKVAEDFLAGKIIAPWENKSLEFNVIKSYIDRAQAIIVHSDFAYQTVKGIRADVHIKKIELHTPTIHCYTEAEKSIVKKELGILGEDIIMGAFGFASKEKRIPQILEALSLYKNVNENFKFYIIGKVAGINIEDELQRLDLQQNVIVKGFVDLDDFKRYMVVCDIAFNLRYPTQGESSASLTRLLGMGKCVFVTDVGTFSEYPDDVVFKIKHDENEIQEIFQSLLKFEENADVYRKNAYKYAKINNNLSINACKYKEFFEEVLCNKFHKANVIDNLLDHVFEYEMNDEKYIKHLSDKLML